MDDFRFLLTKVGCRLTRKLYDPLYDNIMSLNVFNLLKLLNTMFLCTFFFAQTNTDAKTLIYIDL